MQPSLSRPALSGSALKLLAMLTMFIDHLALGVLSYTAWATRPLFVLPLPGSPVEVTWVYLLRKIGRLAFPIFAFLLVEGFLHTKNRKKYAWNLGLFALLSELPFNLCIGGSPFYPSQNTLFTLLIALLAIWAMERWEDKEVFQLLIALLAMAAATLFKTDGLYYATLLPLMLYLFRYQPRLRILAGILCCFYDWFAALAFLPICLYNGERGFIRGNGGKYACYVFYPLHLLLLALLRILLFPGLR